ncbi:cupin [Mycolicibacterium sp. TY66]|uniref:cupin domain-containing protein n=1 Tax=unclassified Mycolicibacterium TaxID=2636767 RepID=UPI001BB419FD|nr:MULTISPECIES: cupin domain-containing protein [unclassified Mycolicibacterium]BCI80344.1 cupin [Mycolicibacterium sp. TY66]BCJ81993.1 cupin [Mycolicibacterium sp. TY81]
MTGMRCATVLFAAAVFAGTTGCASSLADTASPTPETLTPLIEQALPNVPGKTFTSAVVEFPPGARAAPHRHGDAFIYAYVLDGAVRSQVDDSPVTEYRRGQNWVEQPGAHHVLTENTSQTEPAKLLVVFVSNTGDSLKVDDPHR